MARGAIGAGVVIHHPICSPLIRLRLVIPHHLMQSLEASPARMAKKSRLDQFLVTRGFFGSREQAQRAIMAGEIKVGTRVAAKASELIAPETEVSVAAVPKYVG